MIYYLLMKAAARLSAVIPDVYKRQDQALYQAKQQGRNQVRVYGESGSPQAAVESERGLFGI